MCWEGCGELWRYSLLHGPDLEVESNVGWGGALEITKPDGIHASLSFSVSTTLHSDISDLKGNGLNVYALWNIFKKHNCKCQA